ncbi:hypothetical protein [Streptomyces sp. McG3]|uniref:hypothetical protein n=1 Tax=Streptomyces sp. McG3 TaxID=2725483 RepID=UPI001BE9669C|nr:hypothetical protein [Streptomyces sp. McG3]MBT2896582.1 hypothetical protein [Streptomyces sp. McG3]
MLARITVKKTHRVPVLAGAGAALLLAGFVAGIATTAQADSPVCGQTSANIVGAYYGERALVELKADGTGEFAANVEDEATPLTWRIDDSAVVVRYDNSDYVLIPGCAGKKVRPETLIGGSGQYMWVLHRNA